VRRIAQEKVTFESSHLEFFKKMVKGRDEIRAEHVYI
jgi:hypothetical protein